MAGLALVSARRFLSRWSDRVTSNLRDDLVQEAAWEACRRAAQVRDHTRFPAMVRTIARRLRCRALCRALRRLPPLADEWQRPLPFRRWTGDDVMLTVAGRPVSRRRLLAMLDLMLERVGSLNRALLLGFYEGFSCVELGDRFELTVESVKVRLHRGRRRLRRAFEEHIRAADGLDG